MVLVLLLIVRKIVRPTLGYRTISTEIVKLKKNSHSFSFTIFRTIDSSNIVRKPGKFTRPSSIIVKLRIVNVDQCKQNYLQYIRNDEIFQVLICKRTRFIFVIR